MAAIKTDQDEHVLESEADARTFEQTLLTNPPQIVQQWIQEVEVEQTAVVPSSSSSSADSRENSTRKLKIEKEDEEGEADIPVLQTNNTLEPPSSPQTRRPSGRNPVIASTPVREPSRGWFRKWSTSPWFGGTDVAPDELFTPAHVISPIARPGDSQPTQPAQRTKLAAVRALSITEQYRQYLNQSMIEIRRNRCQFCLGCGSIFLVVFIVAVALTTLSFAPILFLGLAEANSGEIDLTLVSSGTNNFNGINYTAMSQVISKYGNAGMTFNSPRIVLSEYIYAANTCPDFDTSNPSNSGWTYLNGTVSPEAYADVCNTDYFDCLNLMCGQGAPVTVFAIDSVKEETMGLGRGWGLPPVPRGHCYLFESVALSLGVNEGDYIVMVINFVTDLTFFTTSANYNQTVDGSGLVNVILKVDQILSSGGGKLPSSINGLVIELDDLIWLVAQSFSPNVTEVFRQDFASLDVHNYVSLVNFNYPAPRFTAYLSSNFPTNARTIVSWSSGIVYILGINQISTSLPVLSQLQSTQYASSFLGLVLNLIILLLSGISILLIYSLLLVSVESRTFELGIFRMIGLNRAGLVQMLLVHAMMFAVPAWAIGLILAQGAFVLVARILEKLTLTTIAKPLTAEAILVSTALGLVIPIIASFFPIRAALTKNLHDALDTQRSKTKAVMITVERNTGDQYATVSLAVGILTSVFGFLIYYILPLALLTSNVTLLFNIFLLLLAGMLIGLVLLSLNLQPLVESILMWITFTLLFFENRALPPIIKKNLQAHRMRNRKTAITYATALGFIIFLSVAVDLEINSIYYSTYQTYGSTLRVSAWSFSNGVARGIRSRTALEAWAANNSDVIDFAWISYELKSCWNFRLSVQLQNVGRYTTEGTYLYSASPNVWEAFQPGYTVDGIYDPTSPYTYGEQMYSVKGSNGMISGQYLDSLFGVGDLTKVIAATVTTNTSPVSNVTRTLLRSLALLQGSAIFTFTSTPSSFEDAVVSFPLFVQLSNGQYKSVEDIPMRFFIIRLNPNLNTSQINAISRSIPHLSVGSVDNILGQFGLLVNQQTMIQYIFELVTLFTLMIAFFSLNTSMFTNIMEQTKEIGILRALGLAQFPIFRIYIYEAFFLVFSSAILGVIIGVLVGWSISAQRALFTATPIPFIFPWDLTLITFAVAIICAVLATFLPVWRLVALPVVGIFRLK